MKKKKKALPARLPPVVTPVILRPKKTASLEALQLKYDSGNANLCVSICIHISKNKNKKRKNNACTHIIFIVYLWKLYIHRCFYEFVACVFDVAQCGMQNRVAAHGMYA